MDWTWFNAPPAWEARGDRIVMRSGPQTDFWRKTHDGGIRHTGHFYYRRVLGEFQMDARLSGQYTDLYDQAGFMLRADESTWLKCGIEFVNGVQHVSAVVTHDYSDWSVIPLPQNPPTLWLRLVRTGKAVELFYALDGTAYTMFRQTFLTSAPDIEAGLMCAAPIGDGFEVIFEGVSLRGL
ncbi:MAG: DUF1349 domain-containing protein [Anaerolineae bacterium]|nr:DUF1349 domain-containing protein [Anaerolineae bacterium]